MFPLDCRPSRLTHVFWNNVLFPFSSHKTKSLFHLVLWRSICLWSVVCLSACLSAYLSCMHACLPIFCLCACLSLLIYMPLGQRFASTIIQKHTFISQKFPLLVTQRHGPRDRIYIMHHSLPRRRFSLRQSRPHIKAV